MGFEQAGGLVAILVVVIAAFWVFWRKSPGSGDHYESEIGMQEPRNDGQGNDYL